MSKHHTNVLLENRSHLTARQSIDSIISYSRYFVTKTDNKIKEFIQNKYVCQEQEV